MVITLSLLFVAIEIGYRVLDPFPYFGSDAVTRVWHEPLMLYDDTLGWAGIPGGRAEIVNWNARIDVALNSDGYRDIEHERRGQDKPAVVFLGDSFTWGHSVEFDRTFVTRVRERLPEAEVYNLSHSGYGTDQELLALRRWSYRGPVRWVFLMFTENDVIDNNSALRYMKFKPRYKLAGDSLVLTRVPVRRDEAWDAAAPIQDAPLLERRLKRLLFSSHFVHDVYNRLRLLVSSDDRTGKVYRSETNSDLSVTREILRELRREAENRGGKLVVFFIPAKAEIQK